MRRPGNDGGSLTGEFPWPKTYGGVGGIFDEIIEHLGRCTLTVGLFFDALRWPRCLSLRFNRPS